MALWHVVSRVLWGVVGDSRMRFVSTGLAGVMPVRLMIGSTLAMLVALKLFVFSPALEALLIRSFEDDGTRWVRSLASELELIQHNVVTNEHEGHFHHFTGRHVSFASTIGTALTAGNLSQVDLSIPECDCVLKIVGSDADLSEEETEARLEKIIDELHVLVAGELSGQRVLGDAPIAALPKPVSNPEESLWHKTVKALADDGTRHTFGVTKATIRTHGDVPLLVRVFTDVTKTAHGLTVLFWIMAGVAATLTGILVYGGTHLVQRSIRSGEMSDLQARYLAEHDSLTGLYNRYGFSCRAETMIAQARQMGKQLCLAQVDVDKFKDINDLHGHSAGDDVLVEVARMIERNFPDGALAARLGGDEFAVTLILNDAEAESLELLRAVETKVSASVTEAGRSQKVVATTSLGYAIYPRDGQTLFELMKSADLALYNVKKEGRNGTGGYHPEMGRAFERRLWEIDGILSAAKAGEIEPHYQPIVNATTGDLEGLEALVRWRHPKLGLLTPVRFAHALADPAASRAVTQAMLAAIADDLSGWWQQGYHFSVGLNVSEADLKSDTFLEEVIWALDHKDLPRHALAIEVTEQSVNRKNLEEMSAAIQRFRDEGMYVALDDFGTDGSSLSILRALPCTAIKIDKSFTHSIASNAEDLSIVEALIALAHALGLKIIAEGVETREQRAILRTAGAELLQGHYFSTALPAHEIDSLLASWKVAPRRPSRVA